jgi:hypothetical protein
MPRLHAEALIFCSAWLMLVIWGGMSSLFLGILLSGGLMVVLMALSATIITKREDMALERQVRWGLLVLAAAAVLVLKLAGVVA